MKGGSVKKTLSRRELLLRSIRVSAGGVTLAALAACSRGGGSGPATHAAACYDPDTADPSVRSLRESQHYTEVSRDPATVCRGCTYSHFGSPTSTCGTCDIYSGGPVNAQGHCDSWAKRAS